MLLQAAATVLLATQDEPFAAPRGARIVASPAAELAEVTALFAPLRGGGAVYRGETAYLLSRDGDSCELLLQNSARGWVPCARLAVRALTMADLTRVPAGITLQTADGARQTVHVRPVEFDRRESIAPGIAYRERRWVPAGDGPFRMQILEVDPRHPAVNVLPVHALDAALGKETPGSMAKRYGAQAAVNGGYFFVTGPYAGASQAMYQRDGQLVSSGPERSSLALCEETRGVEAAEVNLHRFRGRVTIAGGTPSMPLHGLNRPRGADEMILYRAPFTGRTRTEGDGIELVLDASGRVLRVETASAEVPVGGAVLSAAPGAAAVWLRDNAPAGTALNVEAMSAPESPGCKAVDIIGAGPRLVRNGKVEVTEEGFAHQKVRHPRTAFAVTGEGAWLFVTLDGRQPASNGMTLAELAAELVALGAREAINLDGGGSTVMIAGGRVRNNPSDGRERPVSDAILIFSTPDAAALQKLLDTLAQDARHIAPGLHQRLRERLRAGSVAEFAEAVRGSQAGISAAAARLLLEAAATERE